ncbi:MAG: sensor histidine kinase [Desulfobacterales bacterium]|nr:sensor histidine kinase [Desulfobacterales bacterium]
MKLVKRKKIFHKFLTFVLPMVFFSIVITSVVLSWSSYAYFRKTINQDYRNIIKSSAGEIRLFVDDAKKGLKSLAWVVAATKLDAWQKQMALTAFLHTESRFKSVTLVSREGETVATTILDGESAERLSDEIRQKALTGESVVSGVMVEKGDIPYIHLAIPVFHLGEVVEVLWGVLNLKSVWDVLEGVQIGETGQVYIMDLSGRFLAHREIDRVVTTPPAEKPGILEEIRFSDEPIEWIEEKNGRDYYSLGVHIPDFDWIIVLNQALPEIYTYIYRNIYRAAGLTCLICGIAILLGWFRVKKLLKPVHTLHRQVQRIGAGDLDHKATIEEMDEIGDLGAAFNDMTDSLREHIDREIKTARKLAHAKNLAVLGEASSKVTHEVGNLLNNIGLTLTVLGKEDLGERGEKVLGLLKKEADRVKTFIENFLQFAKEPRLKLSSISMSLIIEEALEILEFKASDKKIRLEIEWPEGHPMVDVDSRLMHQVVNNLVKNAMDAMTGPGVIRLKGEIEEQFIRVVIEDEGPGIAPDVMERIFDPFFTTKGKKGTGLGLAIVKSIMEAHRGSIECESELQKGTTFILKLPLKKL